MVYDDGQAWRDMQSKLPTMTIFYVFLLRKGASWTPDSTPEIDELQKAHLANYTPLAEMGKLVLAAYSMLSRPRGS